MPRDHLATPETSYDADMAVVTLKPEGHRTRLTIGESQQCPLSVYLNEARDETGKYVSFGLIIVI